MYAIIIAEWYEILIFYVIIVLICMKLGKMRRFLH